MKSSKLLLIGLSLAFLAAGCNQQILVTKQPATQEKSSSGPASVAVTATLTVAGVGNLETISLPASEGKTVLDVMKEKYKLETKHFAGVGEYIESINGVKPDKNHFWALYVNGKQSLVGAGDYKIKKDDKIEWKLEAIKAN